MKINMLSNINTSNSNLKINLANGGKIESLTLSSLKTKISKEIIQNKNENFFLSGSYLLYPFVNRIESNTISYKNLNIKIEDTIKDNNNFPIHGLYFNSKRKIIHEKLGFDESILTIQADSFHKAFPEFIETFILRENSLEIITNFINKSPNIQYFSYGYHPYFQLEDTIYSNKLESNLFDVLPLTHELLPKEYFLENHRNYLFQNFETISEKKLDHCITNLNLHENPFVKIISSTTKNSILIESTLNKDYIALPYFQIFTPPDGRSIAIEPLTSSGNVFFNPITSPVEIFPSEQKTGKIKISFE
jgi:galactose mutarotase-like enzyme